MSFNRRPGLWMANALALSVLASACASASHNERRYEQSERPMQREPMPPARVQKTALVADRAADQALRMIGKPYRYGGNSPASGFDCSGLVQFSYRQAGASLPRTTDALRHASVSIPSSALQRGDLVFFDQEGKKNGHVGLYLGAGEFVHSPSSGGRVRRDSLQSTYWRKHFSQARRISAG